MNAEDARRVLLVRSFEAPLTPPWTQGDAAWASAQAARAGGERTEPAARIAQRARIASARLAEREPAVQAVLSATSWPAWLGGALVALALLAGVASDAIGPSQRINILAPPLLALLAWNLAVYAALVLGALRAARRGHAAPTVTGPIRRALGRLVERVGAAALRRTPSPALPRFVSDWVRAAGGLHGARLAAVLHAAAAAFATGALASLYLRGLAFEYRAGWDSTFLTPQHVHQLLGTVLGPAAALAQLPLPDAQQLASLRFSTGAGENAARWIHLYALTTALGVLLPRGLLAAVTSWRAHRLAQRFPLRLDEAYYQRLLPAHEGATTTVQVVPYSYRLAPELQPALRAVLERGLGPRLVLALAEPVALGDEDQPGALPPPQGSPSTLVALFALTATPERENHGAFVQALAARGPAAARLIVLVDESGFRERFGGADSATRLPQRRQAWRALLGDLGHAPVFVDLAAPDLDAAEADLGNRA